MKRYFLTLFLLFLFNSIFSQTVSEFCDYGKKYEKEGNYVDALSQYQMAEKLIIGTNDSVNKNLWHGLAKCYVEINYFNIAEEYCSKIMNHQPDNQDVFNVAAIRMKINNKTMKSSETKITVTDKENKGRAIIQMNYCIYSLTSIVTCPTMALYEHEMDQLLNNLTMPEIDDLDEVADFRQSLLMTLNELEITEQERQILRRVQLIQKDNQLWNSLSSGLSGLFLIPIGGDPKTVAIQMVFNGLLTVARTYVDYSASKKNSVIEELQTLWNLKKRDMESLGTLRSKAFELVHSLYKSYGLAEYDRLTEKTARNFYSIISDTLPQRRIRRLIESKDIYCQWLDYDYYLGMAYLDDNKYNDAKPCFDRYVEKYSKYPLFRNDSKSGCIALAMLANEKSLDATAQIELITKALKELPEDGSTRLLCAIKYRELGLFSKCDSLLRSSLENPNITDKELLISYAIGHLKSIKEDPQIYHDICYAIESCKEIDFTTYMSYLMSDGIFNWQKIESTFKIVNHRNDGNGVLNDKLSVNCIGNFRLDLRNLLIYNESVNDTNVTVNQFVLTYKDGFTVDEIASNYDFNYLVFTPQLLNLFFEPLIDGFVYKVRSDVNYDNLLNESDEYRQKIMSSTHITSNDIKKLSKFCREHKPDKNTCSITCSQYNPNDSVMLKYLNKYYSLTKKIFGIKTYNRYNIKGQTSMWFSDKRDLNYLDGYIFYGQRFDEINLNNSHNNKPKFKFVQNFSGYNNIQTDQLYKFGKEEYITLVIQCEKPITIKYRNLSGEYRLYSIKYDGKLRYKYPQYLNARKQVEKESEESEYWIIRKYHQLLD